ncbi:SNF-domain-containing protein [Polychaeton citri CBS 116435]|uniref:SNF-domain-containing protein n=1 Tax=Polychaeton citri CBS 116435 TaxID=1314669 RepID=A0A9P4UUC4_9PEZI|nr:SNF-domain-containing protein [Polychaeton citri CBS 116435]
MNAVRKVTNIIFPPPRKGPDGRDEWPSRAPYLLASMGGAMGFGNLLRFPSQVFNNNGLQWFIPYLIAIFFLAIPTLMLEVSIGQAYRSGCVIAYNGVGKRFRGVGMGMIMVGFIVSVYYTPILSWVMVYFRSSFTNSFPWMDDPEAYYMHVVNAVSPIPGTFSEDGSSVRSYARYPGTGIDGELVGWTIFSWLVIWLCLYKGIAVTARAIYITIVLPILLALVLLGRGVSLPNAVDGIKLYVGEFNGGQLAAGGIWQAATGQVFYSTGIGFGYFTAYASYNSKFADAVQDSILICCSNALFEIVCAFAVFGVVGFLGLKPGAEQLGSFELGFLTLPNALEEMPAAPFWAVLFFLTLFLLGISSCFAMLDALVTTVCDTDWGSKVPRWVVSTSITVGCCLMSLMYCTEFGYFLLNAVDAWTNNVALIFVVWAECVAATILYRHVDIVGQVGWAAFLTHQAGYLGGMVVGNVVAHSISPEAGAGAGFGLYAVGVVASVLIANTPDSPAPSFWKGNIWLNRFWWMAAYSGNQLQHDLNYTIIPVGAKQWRLPVFWAPILRYIAAPTLSIIFTFAYPTFYPERNDPLEIFGFTVAHTVLTVTVLAFIVPRFLDIFVPKNRMDEGQKTYAPQVTMGQGQMRVCEGLEAGDSSSDMAKEKEGDENFVMEEREEPKKEDSFT